MKFYLCEQAPNPRHSGYHTDDRKWGLPGVQCPVCNAIWSTAGDAYPSVDLSHLPAHEQGKYGGFQEDYAEFERLREQVRPLVPSGVHLWPGTKFGPMMGSTQGQFGPLVLAHSWNLLMQREPLERFQAEGLGGLKGCRTEMRFRKKNPPELLEMELLPRGRVHPDCLPVDRPAPCTKCERKGWTRPSESELILDADTLPQDLDLFRLEDFLTTIICTERFVQAVKRLGYEQDIAFRELPVRGS
ncbi:double-CXXCG motif protein [Hyalangium sp.]|uniref:SitI6 family double-CXXCG motif immunity protein n=1 Tax=Hyalangium sp. TaxID=2028555 RepID=UPI002D3E1BCE|nr:double-CXXCG motif protein [Hyalangium sp.]HYI01756.1 double-CXXCG motif protein [Hyalangium sp.]